MNSKLQQAFSTEDFRNQAHQLVDLLADYLDDSKTQKLEQVIPYKKPAESLEFWQNDFDKGVNPDPTALFEEIIKQSTHLHHPKYMGHQVVPPVPLAATAGFLSEFLNNGMAVYEMGLVSNPIERIVTEWMNSKVGYDKNSNGLMTSGGTLGNLTALLTARAKNAPGEVWTEGHQENLAIMVSEEAHYCVDRAARIMGLGTKGIIKIQVDDEFKMKTELLNEALLKAKQDNLTVFAIIGSASSTSTGSHDNLEEIATFAEKNNIWFHVDGAHGGAAIFSKKYNYLLKGINKADSIVIDFHKMMMTPALATAVLYKNGEDSFQTFQQKAQYLWADQTSHDWFNSGKRTFECTKLGMALKVYALLKTYGEEIFEENVDVLYDLGKGFAKIITENPNFELGILPETNIVNFRFIADHKNLNELNSSIRAKIVEDGKFYIVQTTLKEKVYLRVSIMNPLTTPKDLTELLNAIEIIAKSITI